MRILYICTGNSFRSPSAEALTRKYHPSLEVESAGIDATDHIAGVAKDLLGQEDAKDFVKPSPDQVSQRALDEADVVVAMMPEHREYLVENFDLSNVSVDVWNVGDPIKPRVGAAESFEEIKRKVKELPDS